MKKNKIKITFLLINLLFALNIFAQHEHQMQDTLMSKKHTMKMSDGMQMDGMEMNTGTNHSMSMSSAFSLSLPMSRNGSGTGWLPDASPMYGMMFHSGKWMYMLHGNVFLRYDNQNFTKNGSRGSEQIDAPNWLMLKFKKIKKEHPHWLKKSGVF